MKTYKDIVKTEEALKELGYRIENNIIEKIDVNIVGHFGNITTLEVFLKNCCLFSQYNLGGAFPYVIKSIIELLDLTDDNGVRLSKIKNIPVRLVIKGDGLGEAIGIGNFMKDEFVLVKDAIDMSVKNAKEACSKW